jgi:DNA primase
LLFDSDAAGISAARRAIENMIDSDLAMQVARLPLDVDPDQLVLREGKEKFVRWLAENSQSVIEFLTEQAIAQHGIRPPETKARAAAVLIPLIGKVRNAIVQREWMRYVADKLGVPEETLQSEFKRMTKQSASRAGKAKEKAVPSPHSNVRSAEEEILQIVIAHPHCRAMVTEDIFKQERNQKLFSLLRQDIPATQLVNHVDEQNIAWFTELMLEEKSYTSPEQTLAMLLKDIQQRDLEVQRQALEKEVVRMINGQDPVDSEKIQLYQNLNKQLKGSVRSE